MSVLMTNNAGSVKCSLKHNKPRFVNISPSHLLITRCRLLEVGPPGLMRARARPPMSPLSHVSTRGMTRLMDWDTITPDLAVLAFSSCQSLNARQNQHSDFLTLNMICGSSRLVAWWDVMTIVWPLEGTETYFTPNISIEAHYGTNSRWLTGRRGDQR